MKKTSLATAALSLFIAGTAFVLCPTGEQSNYDGSVSVCEALDSFLMPKAAAASELRHIGLCTKKYETGISGENGKKALTQVVTEINLADGDGRALLDSKELPKLKKALDSFNKKKRKEARDTRVAMLKQALTEQRENEEYFNPYYDCGEIYVRRSDSLVTSFLSGQYRYSNGVHGSYFLMGVNIDTATGKELKLSDVMNVSPKLTEAIVEELRRNYHPDTFFEGFEKTVAEEISEENIVWVLEAQGITFYFNQYNIAPYASGILTATFLFDERPDLFNKNYMKTPLAYCAQLRNGEGIAFSLGNGESKDKLGASAYGDGVKIFLNGEVYDDPVKLKDAAVTLVRTENGRNFLYVDAMVEDMGERRIRIYSLDGGVPAFVRESENTFARPFFGKDEGYVRNWVMTDPREFMVEESTPAEVKTHVVETGEDGGITFG